jgi:hypothetical protein
MFDHQSQRFRKTKNSVGRFAPGIGEIWDREKRTINVVVTIDKEQFHRKGWCWILDA